MSVLSVSRCAACQAVINPNWVACLACGQVVSTRRACVPLTQQATSNHDLALAYPHYWTLTETEPMEVFRAAYLEIARLEAQLAPEVAWHTLRAAAAAHHGKTGVCPFCRERGDLHLAAGQLALELSGGRREAGKNDAPSA